MAIQSERKFAVITGASSGIGRELAKLCVANGFDVVICSEDTGIERAATEIGAAGQGNVRAVRADLATKTGCAMLVAAIDEMERPIDALLLNAGVGVGGAFIDTKIDDEINMVELNCNHTLRVAKALVPRMVKRGQGRILITASVVSTTPAPYQAVYGATKAFVYSFAFGLREELKDTGVTVTALQPAATDTNFFHRANMDDTPVGKAEKDPPADVAKRGFEGMLAGKDAVLGGGFKGRMEGRLNEVLPESIKAHNVAKTTKPQH